MSSLVLCASSRLLNPFRILSFRNEQHLQLKRFHNSNNQQAFDYLLILDFEATCDKEGRIYPQEIIEFPVLKVDTKYFEVRSHFHRYVKPEIHPELTSFCSNLTGIIQDMVDNEAPLKDVLNDFHLWLDSEGLSDKKFTFVTCGDWDLRQMLPSQLSHLGLPLPDYFKSWINIKKIFADETGVYPRNFLHMLTQLKLHHVGRLHSGIDDCINTANLVKVLGLKNCHWRNTTNIDE